MKAAEPNLELCEVLHTIAGEGIWAGQPAVLVRLSGCNLECRWCDSPRARARGRTCKLGELVSLVAGCGERSVIVSGGEPLLQKTTPELCRRLLERGHQVMVETNGSLDVSVLPAGVQVAMDVKLPGSGQERSMLEGNSELLRSGDQVKMVVGDQRDFEAARDWLRQHRLAPGVLVYLQPVFGQLDPGQLADWLLAERLPVRLGLQLHKLVWPDGRDGVSLLDPGPGQG